MRCFVLRLQLWVNVTKKSLFLPLSLTSIGNQVKHLFSFIISTKKWIFLNEDLSYKSGA